MVRQGGPERLLWALCTLLLARRQLLPVMQAGNQGCGGRLRYLLASPCPAPPS